MRITVNVGALVVLVAICALFIVGLSVRLGLAAIVAATVIDWLYLAAPALPGRDCDRPMR